MKPIKNCELEQIKISKFMSIMKNAAYDEEDDEVNFEEDDD